MIPEATQWGLVTSTIERTAQGFRSSFQDWAVTGGLRRGAARAIENKNEAAYRRGDWLARRRELTVEWPPYRGSPKRHKARGL
jgi:hypothetical protein